jgi:hypothetical protein
MHVQVSAALLATDRRRQAMTVGAETGEDW